VLYASSVGQFKWAERYGAQRLVLAAMLSSVLDVMLNASVGVFYMP